MELPWGRQSFAAFKKPKGSQYVWDLVKKAKMGQRDKQGSGHVGPSEAC